MPFVEGSFPYHGHRISYDVHGTGDRVLVLVHGLLMNRRMYDELAPEIASRGYRVVTCGSGVSSCMNGSAPLVSPV